MRPEGQLDKGFALCNIVQRDLYPLNWGVPFRHRSLPMMHCTKLIFAKFGYATLGKVASSVTEYGEILPTSGHATCAKVLTPGDFTLRSTRLMLGQHIQQRQDAQ